jgi:hypothetical protein
MVEVSFSLGRRMPSTCTRIFSSAASELACAAGRGRFASGVCAGGGGGGVRGFGLGGERWCAARAGGGCGEGAARSVRAERKIERDERER